MAEITISEETTPAGWWRFPGSTCELRIAANQSFRNSEGQLIPRGLVSKPNTCLIVKQCTVNEDLSVVIPVVTELFTTDDSIDLPTAQYTAALFPRRSSQRQMWPDESIASGFALPTYLTEDEPGTTWARIVLANLGAPLINPPSTWPTFAQMAAYVRTVLYQKATSVLFGLVRLDVPADNSADPVVIGANSPRLPTAGQLAALAGTSGTPSASNKYVTNSDPRLVNVVDVVQAGTVFRDAVVSTDGAISSGTNVFSSASHPAVTADASKKIVVYGAGAVANISVSALNGALRTSVSGKSGNNYLLAANASATVSGARWVYGTDNTVAVQAILTGMSLTGAGGVLFFPPGSYVLGSVTVPSGVTIWAMPGTVTIYSISNSVFVTSGGSNITVDGVTIDACGNPTNNGGVTLVGGTTMTNVTVQRCIFKDTFLNGNVAPNTTFNRHGILARNYDTLNIRFCKFYNGLRIKAHGGTGNALNADVHDNYFNTCNENGFSLLDSTADGIARNINFHHNIFEGVMDTGNCVVMGDDGFSLNVTAATEASPTVLTTQTNHNLVTGQRVYVYGATGAWTPINAVFAVTVTASNKFSIPVDSSLFGALTGTVRLASTQEQSNISICDNIFRGPLQSGTSFIQNRGSYVQRNIRISNNVFDNTNGSAVSSTFAINNAVQTVSGSDAINFQCNGNSASGYYDQAVFRLGNIASGVVADNLIDASSQRGIRLGTVSNLKVHHNNIAGCSYGVYFNAGTLSNLEVGHNAVRLPASNNVVGFYIESTVTPPTIVFRRNSIFGAGGSFTNVYGFQDASTGVGGITEGVSYLESFITNLTTTTGLGSFKYRTLLANAVVTELPPYVTPQLLGGTGLNNSATPDVRGSVSVREAYSSAVTVTAILNASPGVPFTIFFTTANVTLQHNASIKLAGGVDFPAQANDSITLMWNGSACVELSREVNSSSATYTTGATPDVRGKRNLTFTYAGATTITNLSNGLEGQTVSILFTNGNATLQNGASILLAGAADFAGTANDILTLTRRSGVWYETGRSLN